jgi:hypothetical protein
VETKGYKSIPGLPDWLRKNDIAAKSENPCANGRFSIIANPDLLRILLQGCHAKYKLRRRLQWKQRGIKVF